MNQMSAMESCSGITPAKNLHRRCFLSTFAVRAMNLATLQLQVCITSHNIVLCWLVVSADLAVPGSRPIGGKDLLNCKHGFIGTQPFIITNSPPMLLNSVIAISRGIQNDRILVFTLYRKPVPVNRFVKRQEKIYILPPTNVQSKSIIFKVQTQTQINT